MARVLIVDDDALLTKLMTKQVVRLDHEAVTCHSIGEARKFLHTEDCDVVLLDVHLPDGNGIDFIAEIQATPSSPEIIIITGLGSADGAELSIKHGVWDYLEKGSSTQAMTLPLLRAIQYREQKNISKAPIALDREGFVGESSRMKECIDQVAMASGTNANVLISGETGTGKEIAALTIHKNSSRKNKPFVVVDCAALPEKLVESMLFGHVKGAFTGAERNREGLIKQADGGTLFLDEVGELPLSLQKSFLRVLQEHRFRPVGSHNEVASDFRLIAATNRELPKMVEEGEFREDLLFRLRSFTIHLPPLRLRSEDLKTLALYHIQRICERFDIAIKGVTPEFLDGLSGYDWPGNIRELVNSLEYSITSAQNEGTLYPMHLPTEIRIRIARKGIHQPDSADLKAERFHTDFDSENFPSFKDFKEEVLSEMEAAYLKKLMLLTSGNISEACKIADLGRSRLYDLLKKHEIPSTK